MSRSGRWSSQASNESGFSLIELVVVIVAMGVAAAVSMQALGVVAEDINKIETGREMEMLSRAIVGNPEITQDGIRSSFGYVGDVGAFPANLQALYVNPGSYSTWNGPYTAPDLTQDSTGFKTDAWGTAYTYTGGVTISSTGGGSTITRDVARASSDYLLNTLIGTITDSAGNIPDTTFMDSIEVVVTYPNGTGGTATKTYTPIASGEFTLDSIPAGERLLQIIYTPESDTLTRYVTVLPRNRSTKTVRFASGYFVDTTTPPAELFIVSTGTSATLGGLSFNDEDLALYDPNEDTASLYFDGNTIFSADEDVDAMHVLANDHILLSTSDQATIGGLTFENEDIVDYDPVADTAAIIYDGSAVFTADEDVDAVGVNASGHILLSTTGQATIGSLTFEDEDIVDYNPQNGTATIIFDGSAIFASDEDVTSVHELSNGNFVISTETAATIGSLSFENEDLVEYDTSTGIATMYFDSDTLFSADEEIFAVHAGDGLGTVAVAVSSPEILRPNGTGTADNFSGSGCSSIWECVDDVTADEGATYVSKGGGGWNNETYAAENSVVGAGTIDSVVVFVRASNNQSVRCALRTGGSLYESSDITVGASYANYSNTWVNNPDTSSPWTWTDIDALEIGVTLKSSCHATQVWMEVHFTP